MDEGDTRFQARGMTAERECLALLAGGEGLGALCEGLGTGLPCLIILNLAATGLTEDHVPALKALCQVWIKCDRVHLSFNPFA